MSLVGFKIHCGIFLWVFCFVLICFAWLFFFFPLFFSEHILGLDSFLLIPPIGIQDQNLCLLSAIYLMISDLCYWNVTLGFEILQAKW